LFNVQPWLDRVRAATSDLEFFEIEAEYVADLNDTHSSFQMTSSFNANLGISVDIYDGKVLIDSINRAALPAATYPFAIGDELVSVDGKSAEDWITLISTWRRWGNPVSTRRTAAGQITLRSQITYPRAAEIGDSAKVVIQQASGNQETYTIPWTKFGIPVINAGPVPYPQAARASILNSSSEPDSETTLEQFHTYKLPDQDLALTPLPWATDDGGLQRTFVNGIGSTIPVFRAGFPSNFTQRLGRLPSDFHYSGTYQASGLTIGYLRFPNFAPVNTATAINELTAEIDYMQKNTDGLVVDVTRNPCGGCYMLDAAARLIPFPFYFFGEQIRVTQSRLNATQSSLDIAKILHYDQWIVDTWQFYVDVLKGALNSSGALTGSIAACSQFASPWPPILNNNPPAATVYRKPMIVLIDEFSISAADIFPSMIQDNARAPLVGMRTSGGGGSVSGFQTGYYSESNSNNTNTLVVRKNPIQTPEYPTAPYVENIGARPDVPLDMMTRDNLVNGYRPYVDQFTQIITAAIKSAQ
jgi:C-terminal processing protease CtpA/Prc